MSRISPLTSNCSTIAIPRLDNDRRFDSLGLQAIMLAQKTVQHSMRRCKFATDRS